MHYLRNTILNIIKLEVNMSEDIRVIDLIGRLEDILHEAGKLPLSKKVGVDRDEMLDLLDSLKESLPYELDTALKILDEQDSILESARNDANFIVEEAKREKEQSIKECNEDIILRKKQADSEMETMMREATMRAEELVSESKTMKDAKARSEKLIREAQEYSRNIRDGARGYSIDKLESVEATLSSILAEVRSDKGKL